MGLALLLALYARVLDLAYLLAVELRPLLVVEALVECFYSAQLLEVNKGIAHIAVVLEVDGKVEKVVRVVEALVDSFEHELLRIFIRNVLNHDCCLA